jgi:hypothetical protein
MVMMLSSRHLPWSFAEAYSSLVLTFGVAGEDGPVAGRPHLGRRPRLTPRHPGVLLRWPREQTIFLRISESRCLKIILIRPLFSDYFSLPFCSECSLC